MSLNKPKVLFFAPYADILALSLAEHGVARSLNQMGAELGWISCGGLLREYCAVMTCHNLPYGASLEEKAAVCRLCQKKSKTFHEKSKYRVFRMEDYISEDRIRSIRDTVFNKLPIDSIIDFVWEGMPVGRWASYEYLLAVKKNDLNFSEEEYEVLKKYVCNYLLVWEASQEIFRVFKPDRTVICNSLYSANRAFVEQSNKQLVPVKVLHSGLSFFDRSSSIMMLPNFNFEFSRVVALMWEQVRSFSLGRKQIMAVRAHFRGLLSGQTVFSYSPEMPSKIRDVRHIFEIPSKSKIVLVSMSSFDERFAGEVSGTISPPKRTLYKDQTQWMLSMLDYAKLNPEIFFIIRVHPREFPNKRESVKSKNAAVLKEMLQDIPANVRVNWPDQGISIFEVLLQVDLVLTAWSTVGIEALAFGLPVVAYSEDLINYPSDLNLIPKTNREYFETISRLLREEQPVDLESLSRVLRYYYLYLEGMVTKLGFSPSDLGDMYHSDSRTNRLLLKLGRKWFVGIDLKLSYIMRRWLRPSPESSLFESWFLNEVPGLRVLRESRYPQNRDDKELAREFLKELLEDSAVMDGVLNSAVSVRLKNFYNS